jgi:hypothetical protein
MPITLQGTAAGFSAEFMSKLPELEAAMTARGLDANDFIVSKDNAASRGRWGRSSTITRCSSARRISP